MSNYGNIIPFSASYSLHVMGGLKDIILELGAVDDEDDFNAENQGREAQGDPSREGGKVATSGMDVRLNQMQSATGGNIGDSNANFVSIPSQQISQQSQLQGPMLHQQQYQQAYQQPYQQPQPQPAYQQYHISQQQQSYNQTQQSIQHIDNQTFQPQHMSDIYARNFQYISRLLSAKESETFEDTNNNNNNRNNNITASSGSTNWWGNASDNSRKNSFDFDVQRAVSSEGVYSFSVDSYSAQPVVPSSNEQHSAQNSTQSTSLNVSSSGNTAMQTDSTNNTSGGVFVNSNNSSNNNSNISPNNTSQSHHYSFGEEVDFLLDFEI